MSEWSRARLADIAEIRFSNVDKRTIPGEVPVRLCNYMDVYGNSGYITNDLPFMEASVSTVEAKRFRVEYGDVMLTKDSETPDDIGIPAVVVDEIQNLVCGYHLALIKPNPEQIDSVYLAKQLGSKTTARYFSRLANGSTRYGLSSPSIGCTLIPVAPLPQQHRIAEILSTVDKAIEQTELLIAKYQQIKAGLMQDLFTRGVTPDGHLRPTRGQAPLLYKESPLGWIPKEWEVSSCAAEFNIDSGITLGTHRRPKKTPHPYLRVANVFRDRIVLDDVAQLETFPGEAEANCLKAFDLLVVEGHANRNEIGRCAMVFNDAEGMLFQNHLFRLRATRVDPRYALLWLNSSHAQHYWEFNCATSSGLNTINHRKLRGMPICVPSSDEQQLIISASFSCREAEAMNTCYLDKLLQQKQGLMHDLLTGRVRVKLSEPANT